MTREEFKRLAATRIIRLDGATGTELVKQGLPPGVSPELWILEHPQALAAVQQAYARSGSDIVYVPSFGGNPVKLAEFGAAQRTEEINAALAEISRKATPQLLHFGDLAPTGQIVEPFGEFPFEECVNAYKRQIAGLLKGGVDGFAIETMIDLQEARAALIAVRESSCDLPVIVTLSFEASGKTLTGTDPVSALVTLQNLGADAFGCNCSTGPVEMAAVLRKIKPYAAIPLVAKPNAGLPKLRDGKTCFDVGPEEFASAAESLLQAGASLLGGCCGTTPAHIAALHRSIGAAKPLPIAPETLCVAASSQNFCRLGCKEKFAVIGERINPTGKKALQAEFRAGKLDLALTYAAEQEQAGAAILDVNAGLAGIDECAMMRKLVSALVPAVPLPLSIDTTSPEAAEAALRLYPGRALFNSISAERSRLEKLLPVAARYGALPVLLPLTEEGIPASAAARTAVLEKITAACTGLGYAPDENVADALIMTISANPEAAQISLDFIENCAKAGRATICGLSNVSFGLPGRPLVNSAFLGLAMGRGLSSAIANPSAPGIIEQIRAADAVLGKDPALETFLRSQTAQTVSASAPAAAAELPLEEQLYEAVLHGQRQVIGALLDKLFAQGADPGKLVNAKLIPALTEVGARFEKKEYYLPQLMQSAAAMREAMTILEPKLRRESGSCGPVFVIATVEGDIHDIGKNIFSLLLKNHGFEVVDLGKDVKAENIVAAALEKHAAFIGLSALMTTTMPRMPEVISLARQRGFKGAVFVGGAAVDVEYARSIGAEYGADAMASVRRALELSKQ